MPSGWRKPCPRVNFARRAPRPGRPAPPLPSARQACGGGAGARAPPPTRLPASPGAQRPDRPPRSPTSSPAPARAAPRLGGVPAPDPDDDIRPRGPARARPGRGRARRGRGRLAGASSERRDPRLTGPTAGPSGAGRGEAPTVPGPTALAPGRRLRGRGPAAGTDPRPLARGTRAAPLTCVSSQVRLEVRGFPVNFLAARVVALVLSLRGLEVGTTSAPPAPLSKAGLAAPRGPRLPLGLQPRLRLTPRGAKGRGSCAFTAGRSGLGDGGRRGRQAAGGPRLPGSGALSALRQSGRWRLLVEVR